MGIDLVLPDFAYLRERVDDIEAIVITHGHEDHLGCAAVAAARAGGDEHPRRPTAASSPSPWRAPSSTSTSCARRGSTCSRRATSSSAGPFQIEMIHLTHSIPDACGVALTTELGTVLFTGDYKFDQTPVGGAPADVSRLAELGREGLLLLCGDSTNADRPGFSTSESRGRPEPRARLPALRGADRGHLLRLEHPPRPAGGRRGRRSSTARSRSSGARCARTSTSAARSGHITVPEGMLDAAARGRPITRRRRS